MNEIIWLIITLIWGWAMYLIGVENGYAKYVNRNNKDENNE